MNHGVIIEACVETLEEALQAQSAGADQIELCSRLDLEGLTPPPSLVRKITQQLTIPVKVMIRPREGNFLYSFEEFDLMKEQVRKMKDMGIGQIVTGILTKENAIDFERLILLAEMASPMLLTFHKAIDIVVDRQWAVQNLKKIKNLKYILTSGGASTAWKGREELLRMKEWAGTDINIIAAGSVTYENLDQIHQYLNLNYYHGRKIVNGY